MFSGVTKLSRFIHLVLWCVRNGAVCSSYFLVCPESRRSLVVRLFSGVSTFGMISCVSRIWWRVRLILWHDQTVALLSGVSKMYRGVQLFSWCAQNVAVLLSCSLVCPECGRVSALLSGVCKLSPCVRFVFWCVQDVAVCPLCPKCRGFDVLFSCVRNVAACSPCFLLFSECRSVSILLSGVFRLSRCVRLVFWCVQNMAVCPP